MSALQKLILKSALWIVVACALLFLPSIVRSHLVARPPVTALAVSEAFREAWRDSFGTDVTDDLKKVIAIDASYSHIVSSIEQNGFDCTLLEIDADRGHIVCVRTNWNFYRLPPRKEKWVLEVLCASRGVTCKVKDIHASISHI